MLTKQTTWAAYKPNRQQFARSTWTKNQILLVIMVRCQIPSQMAPLQFKDTFSWASLSLWRPQQYLGLLYFIHTINQVVPMWSLWEVRLYADDIRFYIKARDRQNPSMKKNAVNQEEAGVSSIKNCFLKSDEELFHVSNKWPSSGHGSAQKNNFYISDSIQSRPGFFVVEIQVQHRSTSKWSIEPVYWWPVAIWSRDLSSDGVFSNSPAL